MSLRLTHLSLPAYLRHSFWGCWHRYWLYRALGQIDHLMFSRLTGPHTKTVGFKAAHWPLQDKFDHHRARLQHHYKELRP